MASTTSTEQSGLFGHLLPAFKAGHRHRRARGRRGHRPGAGHRPPRRRRRRLRARQVAEEKFVADGFGVKRRRSCTTTSCWSAPRPTRPRHARQGHRRGAEEAGRRRRLRVARRQERHPRRRTALLEGAGVDMAAAKPAGYKECGCGMGPALNIGSSTNAYVLTDRGTWLSSRTAATWPSWSKATSPVQPVRRDGGQPGQAPAREGRRWRSLCRLGGVAGRPGRIAATRSAASSCSSPTRRLAGPIITPAETQRHAEEPPHQRREVHRVPSVRDGLFVRELRHLRAGQVAHQGVRLPRDRAQGALHLHAVRRGLVPARLPGGGHHGRQGHRRQGGQRDHLRRLQGLHHQLPLRHHQLRAGNRQGAEVRPLRRRPGLRRRPAPPAPSPTSTPTGPASTR
jgi:hypothetical protein